LIIFAAVPQQAAPAPAAAGGGTFWDWLLQLVQRPYVVETLLAVALLATAVLLYLRLSRLIDQARSRAALEDYLLGVEQALAGDLAGAEKRLRRVLAEDPENHYARLLYARVLAAGGQHAEAHKHHLFLQRAFAIDSAQNDLGLAHNLQALGHVDEASDTAQRVVAGAPQHREALEFLFRVRLAAGDHVTAAAAGERLLALQQTGPRAPALRARLANVLGRAGIDRLHAGEAGRARELLAQARRHGDDATVRLLAARLEALAHGPEAAWQRLLGHGPGQDLLPAVADNGQTPVLHAPAPATTAAVPVGLLQGLAALSPVDRWRCGACGTALRAALVECPHCGTTGRAEVGEAELFQPVPSPSSLMDAIEENRAHVQRAVRRALDDADAGARAELLALREKAVEELLGEAWRRGDDSVAVELLRAMGPAITPALFAAADALGQKRLLPLGSRSPAALVGRVVQGFDKAAMPHFANLFASAKGEHRKIVIDYFLGLGDAVEFQVVLERFPPLEILHRFNKADDLVLRRFLQAVPAGHAVVEVLLLDPTFYREDALLAAIQGAVAPAALEQVLLRRGPTRALVRELITALDQPEAAAVAQRILRQFGERVLDHLLGAFTDPDRDDAGKAAIAELLAALGAPAVERLASAFGPEPTQLDLELSAVLTAIGGAAVTGLVAAYERVNLLEKLTAGLVSRHTNRRVQIVRTLQAIGTDSAHGALRQLLAREKDGNLRLRLQQVLHQLQENGGGAGGGTRGPGG